MNVREAVGLVEERCRVLHYSIHTERDYCRWVERFAAFCRKHPQLKRPENVSRFLSDLAKSHSAATQHQALCALAFFYKQVMRDPLGDIGGFTPAKLPKKLPTVLSKQEASRLFAELEGLPGLMARFCYGAGLRVAELVNVRVQDLDFDLGTVHVRSGKGDKDRMTCLPEPLVSELRRHLGRIRRVWEADRAEDLPGVYLPDGLERKLKTAGKQWGWFWLWPQRRVSRDPRTGIVRRHHVVKNTLQKQIPAAAKRAGIAKRVTMHTLRHSFATHMMMDGRDLRMIQQLMGHSSIETTAGYLHCIPNLAGSVSSPLASLDNVISFPVGGTESVRREFLAAGD